MQGEDMLQGRLGFVFVLVVPPSMDVLRLTSLLLIYPFIQQ
jgi:hypothetical protein